MEMLMFYSLCCCRLCVSSFRKYPVFLVSLPILDFYANIPALYANILCYLGFYVRYRARCAAGRRGGSLGSLGDIIGLVRVFIWVCSLICQPHYRFRIPTWLTFLQGNGDPISADHSWVWPRDGDCDSYIYPPPYLQKMFGTFLCYDSNQLQEYD